MSNLLLLVTRRASRTTIPPHFHPPPALDILPICQLHPLLLLHDLAIIMAGEQTLEVSDDVRGKDSIHPTRSPQTQTDFHQSSATIPSSPLNS